MIRTRDSFECFVPILAQVHLLEFKVILHKDHIPYSIQQSCFCLHPTDFNRSPIISEYRCTSFHRADTKGHKGDIDIFVQAFRANPLRYCRQPSNIHLLTGYQPKGLPLPWPYFRALLAILQNTTRTSRKEKNHGTLSSAEQQWQKDTLDVN